MVMPQQAYSPYGQNPLMQQQAPKPVGFSIPTWLFWIIILAILAGAYFLIF